MIYWFISIIEWKASASTSSGLKYEGVTQRAATEMHLRRPTGRWFKFCPEDLFKINILIKQILSAVHASNPILTTVQKTGFFILEWNHLLGKQKVAG